MSSQVNRQPIWLLAFATLCTLRAFGPMLNAESKKITPRFLCRLEKAILLLYIAENLHYNVHHQPCVHSWIIERGGVG